MNYCQNLMVRSTINNNNKKYNFYNEYIIENNCNCDYCKAFERQIKNIDVNESDKVNKRIQNVTSYHNNYNYTSYLNNIKKNLLKNDLYSKKIFSIL